MQNALLRGLTSASLELPNSVYDADRVIPQDLIEFGQTARNWFCWDLEQKQPRAPFNDGYAGTMKWGRDSVSWDNRVGGQFSDVMEALNGTVNGHVDPAWCWGRQTRTRPWSHVRCTRW